MSTTVNTDRLHALDSLRGVMMWLGIVLHVSVIYTYYPLNVPMPWHDIKTTKIADLLVAMIHSFRMPVFFILAGFFVVLLTQRRGVKGMLVNRLKRLALPFAVLWPLLFASVILMVVLFAHRAARGTWGLDASLVPNIRPGNPLNNTMHLWFLWMLSWFALASGLLAPLVRHVPDRPRNLLSSAFERVAVSPWGFVLLALPLAWVGSNYKDGIVVTSGLFLAPWMEWVHNGIFFAFGLALYVHRVRLFALYQQRWLANAAAGFVMFLVVSVTNQLHRQGYLIKDPFWIALVFNACAWLWSFSLIGVFLRFLERRHPVLDYLAQSSYWVYVIHMPLTIGFGAFLYGLDVPALVKIPVNILLTTVFSLLSYHMLVRSTVLGSMLNGRRYPFALLLRQ